MNLVPIGDRIRNPMWGNDRRRAVRGVSNSVNVSIRQVIRNRTVESIPTRSSDVYIQLLQDLV